MFAWPVAHDIFINTTFRYLDDILNINVYFDNMVKVSKGARIRSQYNQVRHLTQNTNEKVTNLQ